MATSTCASSSTYGQKKISNFPPRGGAIKYQIFDSFVDTFIYGASNVGEVVELIYNIGDATSTISYGSSASSTPSCTAN